MAKRTYPEVVNIKDRPTQVSLRAAWDRLYDLIADKESLESQLSDMDEILSTLSGAMDRVQLVSDNVTVLGDTISTISGDVTNIFTGDAGLFEPLTNGDAASPELIFADGDVIMVAVV